MNLVEIKTQGTKEIHEVGLAFKGLLENYKTATADGWQAGQDIPAILMGSYQDLMVAIAGLENSGAEVKEEPFKAALGAIIPISEGIEILMDKSES